MTVDLGVAALPGIVAASVVAAVLALLALRRWSDQQALARAKAHAQAHLLEFRLFMDDPVAILHSQRDLLVDNARILRLMFKPLLVLAVPMALLLWQLDALYGRAPLRPGEPAIVSLAAPTDSIEVPGGVAVETPALHFPASGETCWRIRPQQNVSGSMKTQSASARIVAGAGIAYLPRPLIGTRGLQIEYPPATVLGFHWLLWFMVLSTIAAFALRRPMRVVF